jgi:hypothetical protein
MLKSPKRAALLTTLFGMGVGLLLTTLSERDTLLPIGIGFLSGLVFGILIFAWWYKNRSKSFFFSWFVALYLASMLATLLGLNREASFFLGGYGLTFWIGTHVWERHLQKPLSWSDLDP